MISYVDMKRDTPSISLIVNALISILMVIALDINGLIDFFSYAAWIFYGLTAATLLVLRYKVNFGPNIKNQTIIHSSIIFYWISIHIYMVSFLW